MKTLDSAIIAVEERCHSSGVDPRSLTGFEALKVLGALSRDIGTFFMSSSSAQLDAFQDKWEEKHTKAGKCE